jgi:vacuolar-type H+-ATPase subunit B/Vma2
MVLLLKKIVKIGTLRYSDASIINEVNNYLHILDPLQSAIGEGMTRRDHSDVSNQVR